MGKLLEQWLAENSQTLARLQPGGGMPPGGAPPGAFPEDMVNPAFGGEGGGGGPVAAPVEIGQPPPMAQGAFPQFQPAPMMQPQYAFEDEGGGGAPGSAIMDAIEAMRQGEEEPQMGPPIPGSPEDIASHGPPQGPGAPLPPGATGMPPPEAFIEPPPGQQGPFLPPGTEGIQPGGEMAQQMPFIPGEGPPPSPEELAQPMPDIQQPGQEPPTREEAMQPMESYSREGERSAFKEGEITTAQDAFDAAPEEVDKAIDSLEQTTNIPIEQQYQNITGNPPPSNMKRRKIGEFLFEFGLNLIAQPPGMAGIQEVGVSMQQTIAGRRGRAQRRQATERQTVLEEREHQIELRKLGLREREIEAMETGARGGSYADFTGEDGYMYSYDRRTGQATQVVGVDGNPIKARPGATGTVSESVQRYNATIDAWKRRAQIRGIEYGGEYELAALRAAENRLIGNRPSEMTDEERRRIAMEEANAITDTTEYLYASAEERRQMVEDERRDAYNYLKYGDEMAPATAPAGGTPDASRLQAGAATPVTDENGNVTYWTLDTNGQPRQVNDDEMSGQ